VQKDKPIASAEKDLIARGISGSFDPNSDNDNDDDLPDPMSGIDLNDVRSFLMQYPSFLLSSSPFN
jgi:hypothetical protein